MRISELSERTGISVPTIKYYIREGLLPSGERVARTQAGYGEEHVARLELIRALREGANLSIATMARVFEALATRGDAARPEYLTVAVAALSDPVDVAPEDASDYTAAHALSVELLAELGWDTDPGSPGAADLARALMYLRRYLPGLIEHPADLAPHADAVRRLADDEIPDTYDPGGQPEDALRLAVLGTALFEPVLLALRKLAHVDRVRTLARRPQ